jgi:nickel-type superoxide dismutase maturation protease
MRWPLVWLRVADTSMQPTLQPGDHLLVMRWARPRVGQIGVFRDPGFSKRLLVKRVAARGDSGYVLASDNPNVSRDSRDFGPVPTDTVVGVLLWRYPKR